MNNAAAISAVNRALAHYRRRQAHAPTDHSAREIAQMSMLAEYLHETHTPAAKPVPEPQPSSHFTRPPSAQPPNRRGEPQGSHSPPPDRGPPWTEQKPSSASYSPRFPPPATISASSATEACTASKPRPLPASCACFPSSNTATHTAHTSTSAPPEKAPTRCWTISPPPLLPSLTLEGYAPAAVVETSPGSFQAWLRHTQPLSKELGTLAAKTLAEQFGADRGAADWRRFGRAPGFTNRKPQHRNPQGLYPFARLSAQPVQPSPKPRPSAPDCSRSSRRQKPNAAPCVSASQHARQQVRRARHTLPLPHVATLPGPASRRRYGVLHRRRRSGLVRVRHRRRTQPRLPLPRHQQAPTSRLHPAHGFQSHSLGRLKSARRTLFGFSHPLPALSTRSISGARAEAVPSSDSSLTSYNATSRDSDLNKRRTHLTLTTGAAKARQCSRRSGAPRQ